MSLTRSYQQHMLDDTAIRSLTRELVADVPPLETVRQSLDTYLIDEIAPALNQDND